LVGVGVGERRLADAPFLAAADLAAAPRLEPAGRRAFFPFDPVDPVAAARPAPRPALRPPAEPPPLPPRPLVPVPPLRPPDRLAEVRAPDPALRPEPPAAPLRPLPDRPDPADDAPEPPPEPRLAPRGGTLGKITSGDSSL
jgi:hypothetical protein